MDRSSNQSAASVVNPINGQFDRWATNNKFSGFYGGFEIGSLPPGEYTLAIRSAHVGGTDKRDTGNRFAFSWFSISSGRIGFNRESTLISIFR